MKKQLVDINVYALQPKFFFFAAEHPHKLCRFVNVVKFDIGKYVVLVAPWWNVCLIHLPRLANLEE